MVRTAALGINHPEGHVRCPPIPTPPPLDLRNVVAHTLANGLRVRVLPDRMVPAVSYYTFFRVGSRNERPGITGISHFFEHMMFNGSKNVGAQGVRPHPRVERRLLERASPTAT